MILKGILRERYICVEPGHVRGFAKIEPGLTWSGKQKLEVIHEERRLGAL
jgi:glucose-6-phosphate 1-epimerase